MFVLDMGEQVRIIDLARNMIRLSGHRPDQDVKITFIGLRPAEKLYEELFDEKEQVELTMHDKIKRAVSTESLGRPMLGSYVNELDQLCQLPDADTLIVARLHEIMSHHQAAHPDAVR